MILDQRLLNVLDFEFPGDAQPHVIIQSVLDTFVKCPQNVETGFPDEDGRGRPYQILPDHIPEDVSSLHKSYASKYFSTTLIDANAACTDQAGSRIAIQNVHLLRELLRKPH